MTVLFLIVFVIVLFLGMPVAFSMVTAAMAFVSGAGFSMRVVVEKFLTGPDSYTLIAVPFFILAANLMNTGGVTQRIFGFADYCVGHVKGGLGHVNIFASVIFAGMSGAAVADAGGLGQIELKAMRESGFDDDFSLAVTAASSTVGPIIPPSIPAVIYCVTSGASIGKIFLAGFIPGIFMALAMSGVVYFIARRRGYPVEPKRTFKEKLVSFKNAFPALLTPIIVIGGIVSGKFTPTESAIIASTYALILGFAYRELTLKKLKKIFLDTAIQTTTTIVIIAAAAVFGWVLSYMRIPQILSTSFLSLFTSKTLGIFAIMVVLLVVGCFMETIAAITIMTPVLLPIVASFGIDPVHFGILMVLNLMIGLITPPVGLVLYTLSNISKVPFYRIAKAATPFMVILFAVLLVLAYIPQITMFLPNLFYGG